MKLKYKLQTMEFKGLDESHSRDTWHIRSELTLLNSKDHTMKTRKYNGWTNYETWLVNVWQISESINCAGKSQAELAAELLCVVQDILIEGLPETTGFVADITLSVDSLLNEINFDELAEHMFEPEEEIKA